MRSPPGVTFHDLYGRTGRNRFTIRELLAPIEQTGAPCVVTYLAPFAVYATHRLDRAQIDRHAEDHRRIV